MPLFDFTCPSCGHKVEVLQHSKTEVVDCIKCGTEMERKFPAPAMVIIKGEGGYPARRKQIRNTTKQNHPSLEHDPKRIYFS